MDIETTEPAAELPASARRTAAELAALVEAATRDLPFGAEPASLAAALERLAAPEEEGE